MSKVLVLDQGYTPINRISWQKAFNLIWTNRAEVVEYYVDKFINSAKQRFKMPSIVRFTHRIKRFFYKNIKFNRKNVFFRDKGKCQYCGMKVSMDTFTYDHVIPRSQGGETKWENIVVSCFPCNQEKNSRTPRQANMALRSQPKVPKNLPEGAFKRIEKNIPENWKDYMAFISYWMVDID